METEWLGQRFFSGKSYIHHCSWSMSFRASQRRAGRCRSCGHRYQAATVPQIVRSARSGRQRRGNHFGGVQGNRRPRARNWKNRSSAQRGQMRIIGPNCVGVMLPHIELNATFARPLALARQHRFHQPERRALHGDSRLELVEQGWFQRVHFHRFDARCELGRPDLSPRRRSAHAQHPDLHGVDRRRALVSLRGARSCPNETNHRHQSRPHRSRGAKRRLRIPAP